MRTLRVEHRDGRRGEFRYRDDEGDALERDRREFVLAGFSVEVQEPIECRRNGRPGERCERHDCTLTVSTEDPREAYCFAGALEERGVR
jgi:hypothetical protein